MALGTNNETGYITYLSVRTSTDDKGRRRAVITKRCKKDDPGAKLITRADGKEALDKDGNPAYRLEFDYLEGTITKIERRTTEFGKYLDIHIRDDRDYILSLDRGDRYWYDFLQRILNVNIEKPLRLIPYNIEEDGSYHIGIAMRQDGMKIKRRWTSENGYAGGPPPAEQKEVNEEQVWDFGKRNAWLDTNVVDVLSEKLAHNPVEPLRAAAVTPQENTPDDDLPF